MNRDDIIRMARGAGAMFEHMSWVERDLFPVFARFADLVAAAERETCAQLCEAEAEKWEGDDGPISTEARLCALAIRARGADE